MDGAARTASLGGAARRAGRGLAVAAASLAAAGALALGADRALASDALRIRAVRFEGLSRASEAELLALSPVRPGDNLLTADVEGMERALRRHPWVRSVSVRRRLPPALEVRVVEREPRAIVDLGGLYLVDAEARVFKRALPGDGLDWPLVTGFTRDDYVQRRADVESLLAGALALVDTWAREGLADLAPISEVHVDADEGVTVYAGAGGTQVRLGIGDLEQKVSRFHRVLEALRASGKRAEVVHVDDRIHPSWVTVRIAGAQGGEGAAPSVAASKGGRGPRGP